MKLSKSFLLLLCVVLCAMPNPIWKVDAQKTEINQKSIVKGKVVDETGAALPGVNVRIKGSAYGTITDANGLFSVNAPKNTMLQFVMIGFKTTELAASKENMLVQMSQNSEMLNDVMVVAYGTQKKVTMTGSVASVNSKEVLRNPAPNITAALTGKLPGLTTIQTSGEPGRDDVTMFLRGVGTTNDASPLILVDGLVRESIRAVDANEIASVSVLKDASATAVFGVRGANGVILITTKRGEKGKMEVNGSAEHSTQKFVTMPEILDSYQHALLRNEACTNDGQPAYYSDEKLAKYKSWETGTPVDPYWYPNNNWMNIIYKKYAPMSRYNLNISGGTEKVQYFVNAGYLHQGGMFNVEPKSYLGYDPQSKLDRYNFRSNIDYQVNKIIKTSIDISSNIEKINGNNGLDNVLYASVWSTSPTAPGPLTLAGYETVNGSGTNEESGAGHILEDRNQVQPAYGHLNRSGYYLETRSALQSTLSTDLNLSSITKGLSARAVVSYASNASDYVSGSKSFVIYHWDLDPKTGEPYYYYDGDDADDPTISISNWKSSDWKVNLQAQAKYERTFDKKHYVTGMLLAEREMSEKASADLPYNILTTAARFSYAYDYKYLCEVSMGYNGSEQFSPSNRFGFFPAASVGWVVSNEPFLTGNDIVTNLKLRASYGKTGNDRMSGSRFLYLSNIYKSGGGFWNPSIPSLAEGYKVTEAYIGNPDLTWETALKQDLGIDLTLFKDLTLTADYYLEKRNNILIQTGTVPMLQGRAISSLPLLNMGRVRNSGYEVQINYHKNLTKNWNITLSTNYAYNDNKVMFTDEAELPKTYACRYRKTGYSIGQNFGYKIDRSVDEAKGKDGSGFFNSQDQINNSGLAYEIGTPKPGDFIYVDENKDGKINDKDLVPIGYSSTIPKISYSTSLGTQIMNVDFSVMLQGVSKYSKYYEGPGVDETYGGKAMYKSFLNRWSAERYAAKMNGEDIVIDRPRLCDVNGSTSHVKNDYYIMDASFWRIKNIELGYTLPKRLIKEAGIETVRMYANANNLYTRNYMRISGLDPEQSSQGVYPSIRIYNIGINVTF